MPNQNQFGALFAASIVGSSAIGIVNFVLMAVNTGRTSWPLQAQVAIAMAAFCLVVVLLLSLRSTRGGGKHLLAGLGFMILAAVAWHVKTRVLSSTSEAAEWAIFLISVAANLVATFGLTQVLAKSHTMKAA